MGDQGNTRIVISATDLAETAQSQPANFASPPPENPAIPSWGRLCGWIAALSFPILAVFACFVRYAVRNRDAALREKWKGFLCTLLIVSGLTNLASLLWLTVFRPGWMVSQAQVSTRVADGVRFAEPVPEFPTATAMSPVDIAARTKPLVFIITPDVNIDPHRDTLGAGQIGAGVLLLANAEGLLLGTNRHVVESQRLFGAGTQADQAMVISADRQYAISRVVGRHRSLDLALLWARRGGGEGEFRQPIAAYRSIPVGDPVYVVGHPQRLFFTLSNGLISRRDNGMLQLSAPVSPGNSGGPVYDGRGALLGIVTWKIDRERTPNAENLNFATPADAFLDETGWQFQGEGKKLFARLRESAGTE